MPVAKSYQSLPLLGQPFVKSGRQYVNVRMKNGNEKTVRWYTESEYKKLYPEVSTTGKDFKPQKDVLGFEKGYITIFQNVNSEHEEWFENSICRYARHWGWYVISTKEVPSDLPSGVKPIILDWDIVGKDDGYLKSDTEIEQGLFTLLYPPDSSVAQGEIGERLERQLTVIETIDKKNQYGVTTTHIMQDPNKNTYSWTTSAKHWSIGETYLLRGTVKEYITYKNSTCTVLTRCMITN